MLFLQITYLSAACCYFLEPLYVMPDTAELSPRGRRNAKASLEGTGLLLGRKGVACN